MKRKTLSLATTT